MNTKVKLSITLFLVVSIIVFLLVWQLSLKKILLNGSKAQLISPGVDNSQPVGNYSEGINPSLLIGNKTFISASGNFQFIYPASWFLIEKNLSQEIKSGGMAESWVVTNYSLDANNFNDSFKESVRMDFEIIKLNASQTLDNLVSCSGTGIISCADTLINGITYRKIVFSPKNKRQNMVFASLKNARLYKVNVSIPANIQKTPLGQQVDTLLNSFRILK